MTLRNPVGTHVNIDKGLHRCAFAAYVANLDTCHVFAAGAPLDEPGGATATLDRVVELGCFPELLAHPATEGIQFILETPGSRHADDVSVTLLRKLRAA